MKTSYRIASLFDRGLCLSARPSNRKELLSDADTFACGGSPLVNAPLPARETLLAQALRSEIGRDYAATRVGFGVRMTAQNLRDRIQSRRYSRRNELQTKRLTPKDSPKLKGRLLGVEIEYYPTCCTYEPRSPLENVVGDGSLASGGEEIRRLTWQGEDGRLWGLARMVVMGQVKKDCGLHVHVDVRHLTPDQAAATYDRLESGFSKHFKKLCPKSRQSNPYCQWRNNRPGADDFDAPSRGDRYAAFNWQSYSEHGSIEFRMQGNFNPARGRPRKDCLNTQAIETWALICQAAVAWAADPDRPLPSTWEAFYSGFQEPLSSWIRIRKETLWGTLDEVRMTDRTESALG